LRYQKLDQILLEMGLVDENILGKAKELQRESGGQLDEILIRMKQITEGQALTVRQKQLGLPIWDLSDVDPEPELSALIPERLAKRLGAVPVRKKDGILYVAMKNPADFMALEELKAAARCEVVPGLAVFHHIDHEIQKLYGVEGVKRAIEDMERHSLTQKEKTEIPKEQEQRELAPAIRLVNSILERAAMEQASDIHLEPQEDQMTVRMRIDGILHPVLAVPSSMQAAVIARIKVMAGMNITEHRLPQDGRVMVTVAGIEIDLRVSVIPVLLGEKAVLRLLNQTSGKRTSQTIGLTERNKTRYETLLKEHSGVILMAGPTGSGKTTTLYTMIQELNTEEVNLVSLEDPVEYYIKGVNQIPIRKEIGLTFAEMLRAVLRQDPDIVAVGEIRDAETAEITMRAAITGHLVLTTVHTNDAVMTINRLRDAGVAPFLIADALKGMVSQRLVRKICPDCREAYVPTEEERRLVGAEKGQILYRGKGCPHCFGTGYRGRTGIYEILFMNQKGRKAVLEGAARDELLEALKDEDYQSMEDNCKELIRMGTTTVEEGLRVILEMGRKK
jgi:type IV pilus assembly protein PilB